MVTQWDGIEEFLAVAEARSFTLAASQLGVSLSQVSRRVAQLERRVGAKLLERTTRKVALTTAGSDYLLACKQVVAGLELANASLQTETPAPRGHIRVGAVRGYSADAAQQIITRFLKFHPEVSVELVVHARDFDISAAEYDIGLLNSSASSADLVSSLIFQRAFAMAASPEYLARAGVPVVPDDLLNHQCILSNEPFWTVQDGGSTRPLILDGPLRIHNHIDGLINAAVQGLGIVYFSEFYLKPALESGVLVRVLEDYVLRDVGTWLVHPYPQQPPTHVQALIDYMLAESNMDPNGGVDVLVNASP